MIYYTIFLILFLASLFLDNFKYKQRYLKKALFILFSGILFFIASMRYQTGYDYVPYYNFFYEIRNSSLGIAELATKLNMEVGYVLLNILLSKFSFKLFFIVVSALTVLPKCYFISKINKNNFFVLFCYYCTVFLTYDMGIIRQGISLSILLFSIKYIMNRKYIPFQSIVILAALFHSTSIIFSFAYFISYKQYSCKTYFSMCLISIIFTLFFNTSSLLSIIPSLGGMIDSKISYYSNYYEVTSIVISLIKRVIVMFLFLYFCKKKKNNYDDLFWLSLNIYALSIVLMSLFNGTAILATRGTMSLYMFQIVCYSYILNNKKVVEYTCLLLLCLALFFNSFIGPLKDKYNFYLPYKTWIETEI